MFQTITAQYFRFAIKQVVFGFEVYNNNLTSMYED